MESFNFEWNCQNECQLLEAIITHKPVGINKNFQMLLLYDQFTDSGSKEVEARILWNRLENMYNFDALDENQNLPFPNSEVEFELPDVEFGNLKDSKVEDRRNVQKGRETPKNIKEFKKEEKLLNRNVKEIPRRDSKDVKNVARKDVKKDPEKCKASKSRSSSGKEESKTNIKSKSDDAQKGVKRPTRGSFSMLNETSNNGKKSPLSAIHTGTKRRRI